MNITQIEENIQKLIKSLNKDEFIFDFLLAYDQPKASITRLRNGDRNLSKNKDEVLWKKKIFFKATEEDLFKVFEEIKADEKISKQSPRFILVTDFKNLLAIDTKNQDSLDCSVDELPKHFDFFLPIAGMEKKQHLNENPADVKAAERMAKLYDEIKKSNTIETEEEVHNLNVFLSRLLFCYFAEDTGIFDESQFVNAISSHTQEDGSDLNVYLDNLFEILNNETSKRKNIPKYLNDFPYVNGGLFRNKHAAPVFTRKSRQAIIEAGELDWKAIHPDIFGSMIQAVVKPDQRGGYGMHYTSVPNIMKVIEPLFLDELYETFEASKNSEKKLRDLLARIQKIKIFDPACGSGNFLIIAYKELRKLEIKIFQSLEINFPVSGISLSNFYGIELDDFAHEIALLSLLLAEHQMNVRFFQLFGKVKPALPLVEMGNIVHSNATRLKWNELFPESSEYEIFILGNPPYKGFSQQTIEQKNDLKHIFNSSTKLDYISCWYIKASSFIKNYPKALFAFVSTNSICQGEQVSQLWPKVLGDTNEIFFACPSFKWSNNARDRAGVTCVITGIRKKNKNPKYIFKDNLAQRVNFINPYLTSSFINAIPKRNTPLSKLKPMVLGNMPNDYGGLQFTREEKEKIIQEYPVCSPFFKRVLGSQEFINGIERWCLWVSEEDKNQVENIKPIKERLLLVTNKRAQSKKESYNRFAKFPFRFIEVRHQDGLALLIPGTSSERREYIPVGLVDDEYIINNLAFAIYRPPLYLFSILHSKIHNLWVRAVGGSLETRVRYSSVLCYNTFPFPDISDSQKKALEVQAHNVINEREKYTERTIAQLYDPDKMPQMLRDAHKQLDLIVESCYRNEPFNNDEERLEYLFKLYEKMIEEEKNRGTLFEQLTKPKKRKKVNA
jgi:hypothetical protein